MLIFLNSLIIVVQPVKLVWAFVTPRTAALQASLSFIISLRFLKLMSIESLLPSNHLILFHPFLLPSVFLRVRIFSNESALHTIDQRIGASALVLPMSIQNWFPLGMTGLIFLQSKGLSSSKASILRLAAFLTVQLSHPYMTTRKTIVLTIQTFFRKVMSLLFSMLSCLS